MAVKSKKKQRDTEEQRTSAPAEQLAQFASSNGKEKHKSKSKGKGKIEKGTQQSAPANGALELADREPNGRLPAFVVAALGNPDANVRWPVLLLRQGLLLVVDGIDARYGLGQQRSEPDAQHK